MIKTFISSDDTNLTSSNNLMFLKKSLISTDDLYAKPAKKLMEHLIEAGSVAYSLLTEGRGRRAIEVLSERFSIPEEDLVMSICFLCAAHDIGKAHPGFLRTIADEVPEFADTLQKLEDAGLILPNDEHIRHERFSRELIQDYLTNQGFNKEDAEIFSYTIAYHHQNKNGLIHEPVKKYKKSEKRWSEWEAVQKNILDEISKRWPFSDKLKSISDNKGINGLMFFIVSVMVTSDWIVSSDKWESCLKRNNGNIRESVNVFMEENKLRYMPINDTFKDIRWEKIFDFPMNALQEKLAGMDLDKLSLLLLEYPCGYGKTIAALLAAIMHFKDCGGIIFTAPTMNTAKSLRQTIGGYAKEAGLDIEIPEFDSSMAWNEDDEGSIPKDLWVNKSRHQMLYPYAVGTVDQVLKCILSYRYSCIGMLGLSDKVIVIDEMHAYDAYMKQEIIKLVKWCKFFKIPVIMLSATMPTKTKEVLFKEAGMKKDHKIQKGYPLISAIKEDGELIQDTTECTGREFHIDIQDVETITDMKAYMYNEAMIHSEGCLALIAPTVDDAFELYDRISKDKTDCDVILYHSRDTIEHKDKKINTLLKLLGNRTPGKPYRPKNLIVVATSIIEQSLDIDFDRMITCLAPIDLLIQRLGRVQRFSDEGTIREFIDIKNPFTVVIPQEYGVLSLIYKEQEILKRTSAVLLKYDTINTVSDIRDMIDEVYDNFASIKDNMSELYAGYRCLSSPFYDTSNIINGLQESYEMFNPAIPQTRMSEYETVQIAILKEPVTELSYADACKIMKENVVNVPLYKLEKLRITEWENDIKAFKNIKVFIGGEAMTVFGEKGKMWLSEEGLRFE